MLPHWKHHEQNKYHPQSLHLVCQHCHRAWKLKNRREETPFSSNGSILREKARSVHWLLWNKWKPREVGCRYSL
jgi:predicted metal-binding protein